MKRGKHKSKSKAPAQAGPIMPIKQFSFVPAAARSNEDSRATVASVSARLLEDIEVLKDRLGRAHGALREEIFMWDRGFKENEWDGLEAARRRASLLKGALGYSGRPDGLYRKHVEPRK
jgi:hypothetical protein